MSVKISRKMIAEVIAASRGKRMARPLQVQNKAHELRHCISRRKGRLTGYHEVQQGREETLILC